MPDDQNNFEALVIQQLSDIASCVHSLDEKFVAHSKEDTARFEALDKRYYDTEVAHAEQLGIEKTRAKVWVALCALPTPVIAAGWELWKYFHHAA